MKLDESTDLNHVMAEASYRRTGKIAMLTGALAMSCGALLLGCGVETQDETQGETQEIIDNLMEAGFPKDDIQVLDGAVYVGRDAHVTLAASREMLQPGDSSKEQYRTSNLVSGQSKICVTSSAEFNSYYNLSQGLDRAIENYNLLGLAFSFARGPTTGCSANISAVVQVGLNGAFSGFPSGGNPYGQITIGTDLVQYYPDVIEHVITHELGHTIGLRHSDYYNRSISCGIGGDEGDGGVGAILIPGTPSTATVGGSIMNSCFDPNTGAFNYGDFTDSDSFALKKLYGWHYFSYAASGTDSARQNSAVWLVPVIAGERITVGTCGFTGSSITGDTVLRLWAPSLEEVAANDDACGGLGSKLSWAAVETGLYWVIGGCFGSSSCSGIVTWSVTPDTYPFSATNTDSARQNAADQSFYLLPGKTFTVGTCGVAGGSFTGDTVLRLFGPSGAEVAANDDACGGLGSNLSFTVTSAGFYHVHAGCFGSSSCSGTMGWTLQ